MCASNILTPASLSYFETVLSFQLKNLQDSPDNDPRLHLTSSILHYQPEAQDMDGQQIKDT